VGAGFVLLLQVISFAQYAPRMVQVDPNSGEPISIVWFGHWTTPVLVYSDNAQEDFISPLDISEELAAQRFVETGIYHAKIISYYRGASFCNNPELLALLDTPESKQKCSIIGFRWRWVDVDVKAATISISATNWVDVDGFVIGDTGHRDRSAQPMKNFNLPFRTTLRNIGQMLINEAEKEKIRNQ
jgi:hypothetical protein